MIFEATIKFKAFDEKGNKKEKKESYVVENVEFFSEVEKILFQILFQLADDEDSEILSIKKSKIREIANKPEDNDDKLWLSEVKDTFIADDGSEKPIKYKILFYSKTFESANKFIQEYMQQGYDMALVGLKLTNFREVI